MVLVASKDAPDHATPKQSDVEGRNRRLKRRLHFGFSGGPNSRFLISRAIGLRFAPSLMASSNCLGTRTIGMIVGGLVMGKRSFMNLACSTKDRERESNRAGTAPSILRVIRKSTNNGDQNGNAE
jgi:hypothetical protein